MTKYEPKKMPGISQDKSPYMPRTQPKVENKLIIRNKGQYNAGG